MSAAPESPSVRESWVSRYIPYLLLLGYLWYCTALGLRIFDERFDLRIPLELAPPGIQVLLAAAGMVLLLRMSLQVVSRRRLGDIARDAFGEPTWWRTWYPRGLRAPGDAWERLPLSLKILRTLVWVWLLVLPAGGVLAVFVAPTFRAVFESLGQPVPRAIGALNVTVTTLFWLTPLVLVAGIATARRWRRGLGLPLTIAVGAFFAGHDGFWQGEDARKLLAD